MRSFIPVILFILLASYQPGPKADIVLVHGKVITVDGHFTIAEAIAIKDGKIIGVGSNEEINAYIGDKTEIIELHNRTVVPGLIDEHAHPVPASQSELTGEIPDVHAIKELLSWISAQAANKRPGEWIIHPKFFITRMLDMRQLTLRELDSVAPNHPVFLNGSFGGMVNTKALQISGLINSKHAGVLRSKETGKVSGFIHSSVFSLLAIPPSKPLTGDEAIAALQSLFVGYNKMGITSICSGGGGAAEYALYEKLLNRDSLNVRIFHNFLFHFPSGVTDEKVNKALDDLGKKTGDGNYMLKTGSFKLMIDGGVLTGTAYLREGWGAKAKTVYGINDPNYRGNIFYTQDDLHRIISIALKRGWKFSAHVTGGGGVDTLLDAFEKINKISDLKGKRFSIIHGNFFTPSAIDKMAEMNIYADMQPAWYLKDADLLNEVLGSNRMATFHPYRSMIDKGIIINGGSDHMVKMDPNTSVNPYNPFLAMWSMVTRKTERGTVFNPEQAITRAEALKAYTINNAMASFEEDVKGSLEPGKFADLAVLSNDILSCPADSIKLIRSVLTMLNGKIVYKEPVDTSLVFCGHEVILDNNDKLLPRKVAAKNPYDDFLRLRWNFIKTKVPAAPGPAPRSHYPQYYFYCAYIDSAGTLLPDPWMNDVGEKVPMWLESARLYRDYSGDEEPLRLAKGLVDYSLEHGITAADFSWPHFPYTTTNAGDLEFRGFTARFALHDVHVDHAGDLGAAYYKMYLLSKDEKYSNAALKVANVLAEKVHPGTDTISPWPYVVNAKTGKVVSWYGTNWFGCIRLFDMLIADGKGRVKDYMKARQLVKDWLLKYPFKNGKWVDGHTDTYVSGTSNLSNLSASNAGLYVSDHPSFISSGMILPSLIKWTEDNFVFKTAKGEPAQFWGANIVSEQVAFMPKMDYQTARYAAQCAKWYRISGDEAFREKAFRSLNFVTYCNDTAGKAFESPFSKGVNSWWSDSYGECPIMFYHALGAMPSWAPDGEDHILYSTGVLRDVKYADAGISYYGTERTGTEYLRTSFKPSVVAKNASVKVEALHDGDYYVTIDRKSTGVVRVGKAQF
jgi:predicted amidohydrolase YtcJ